MGKDTKGKIIAIVGAPRSGKSFLATKLAEHLGATLMLEEGDSDFPDRIKEDIERNIRPLERILWFRNRLVNHYLDAEELKNNGKIVVMDTFWLSVEPYNEIFTQGFEFEVTQEMSRIDSRTLTLPDHIIFLKNDVNNTKDFIVKGGRKFDASENFVDNFIIPLQKTHEKVFSPENLKDRLMVLDRSKLDFNKDEDLEIVLRKLS